MTDLIKALEAAGLRIVPIDPEPEMIEAGIFADETRAVWGAMLSAAPDLSAQIQAALEAVQGEQTAVCMVITDVASDGTALVGAYGHPWRIAKGVNLFASSASPQVAPDVGLLVAAKDMLKLWVLPSVSCQAGIVSKCACNVCVVSRLESAIQRAESSKPADPLQELAARQVKVDPDLQRAISENMSAMLEDKPLIRNNTVIGAFTHDLVGNPIDPAPLTDIHGMVAGEPAAGSDNKTCGRCFGSGKQWGAYFCCACDGTGKCTKKASDGK